MKNKYKLKRLCIRLIILGAFLCIIIVLGLPVANSEITIGRNYSEIITEENLENSGIYISYVYWRKICLPIYFLTALVYSCQNFFIKRTSDVKRTKKAIAVVHLAFLSIILMLVCCVVSSAWNILFMFLSENLALHEYSRAKSVFGIGLGLLALWFLFDQYKLLKYFRRNNITRILCDHYLGEYQKFIDSEQIDKADKAIEKACKYNQDGVTPWAIRAIFVDSYLSTPDLAKEYFEKSTENLQKLSIVSKEEKACYEFCWADLLFGQEKYKEAERHFRNSLALQHDKDRIAYFEKVKKVIEESELK